MGGDHSSLLAYFYTILAYVNLFLHLATDNYKKVQWEQEMNSLNAGKINDYM